LNNQTRMKLLEEQILHRLGYNVFTIPQLTQIEKKRLVEGYILYESNGEYEDPKEREKQIDELINARKTKCQTKT